MLLKDVWSEATCACSLAICCSSLRVSTGVVIDAGAVMSISSRLQSVTERGFEWTLAFENPKCCFIRFDFAAWRSSSVRNRSRSSENEAGLVFLCSNCRFMIKLLFQQPLQNCLRSWSAAAAMPPRFTTLLKAACSRC